MVNIETKGQLNFTDDGVTNTFTEGDNVICCVGDEKRYVGKITGIGAWKENDETESCNVIIIDTSTSARSYSSEVINVDDITFICKNPLKDSVAEPPLSKKEMDKRTYVSMLVGLGGNKEKAEEAWESISIFMDIFNIPVDKALACSIYSIANKCDFTIPLKDICGIDLKEIVATLEKTQKYCASMAVKSFGELLEIIGKVIKGEEDITIEDLTEAMSEVWSELTDAEKNIMTKLFAGIKE